MFFLLRAAFWLSLVVLLLPSGEDGQSDTPQVSTGEAIGVAQTFVSDVAGFCMRHPDACETGGSALKAFGAKAQYGAKLAYGYLGGFTGNDEDISGRRVATTRVYVAPPNEPRRGQPAAYQPYQAPAYDGALVPSAVATQTREPAGIGALIASN